MDKIYKSLIALYICQVYSSFKSHQTNATQFAVVHHIMWHTDKKFRKISETQMAPYYNFIVRFGLISANRIFLNFMTLVEFPEFGHFREMTTLQ